VRKHVKDAFETKKDIYYRSLKVKDFLKQFRSENPVEGDERIVLVCHSQLISALTSSGYEHVDGAYRFKDFVWTQNTEVLPLEL